MDDFLFQSIQNQRMLFLVRQTGQNKYSFAPEPLTTVAGPHTTATALHNCGFIHENHPFSWTNWQNHNLVHENQPSTWTERLWAIGWRSLRRPGGVAPQFPRYLCEFLTSHPVFPAISSVFVGFLTRLNNWSMLREQ